jgi:hydrogenase-4 membrane subunit HyfE
VAASKHIDELYVLAVLSLLLKVLLVPGLIMRLLRDADTDLAGSSVLGVASAILIAIVVAAFGFFAVGLTAREFDFTSHFGALDCVRRRARCLCTHHLA